VLSGFCLHLWKWQLLGASEFSASRAGTTSLSGGTPEQLAATAVHQGMGSCSPLSTKHLELFG